MLRQQIYGSTKIYLESGRVDIYGTYNEEAELRKFGTHMTYWKLDVQKETSSKLPKEFM